MKVKNIMFSGVMGVILMSVASSANAAISVASKAYVDTKASNIETAYKEADTALDTRVTKNTDDIAAVKQLTGTEGVAEQITAAKTELTTEINKKVDTATYTAKVGELEAADTGLAEDIAGVDAKFADYTKTADLDATFATNEELAAAKSGAEATAAAALQEYKTANDTAVAAKVAQSAYDAKVGELEAADTALAGDIDAVDAKFGDYTKTADLDATFATNDELAGAVSDLEDADEALDGKITAMDTAYKAADTTLDGKISAMDTAYKAADTTLDGKITAMDAAYKAADTGLAEDIAGVDAKFADYTKTSDLNTTYVSETEMSEFQTSNTAAIADAKKAGTDASAALEAYKTTNDAAVAAKVAKSDYDAKVLQIENALGTKIEMPAECATTDCVLAINKASGTISWTPLTEPVADFINQQN